MKINKDNMIITIDSELGSNGDLIGKEISNLLGVPCYGEEILDMASEISGIAPKLMHRYDGRAVRAAYDLTAGDNSQIKMPQARDFITAQVFASRKLAASGSCILVDRHASAALAGNENRVSIFIHSNFNDRAAVFGAQKSLEIEAAKKSLKKADRAYRSYYRGNNYNWGDADQYDLTLNTSDADIHAMASMVVAFLESVTGEKLTGASVSVAV